MVWYRNYSAKTANNNNRNIKIEFNTEKEASSSIRNSLKFIEFMLISYETARQWQNILPTIFGLTNLNCLFLRSSECNLLMKTAPKYQFTLAAAVNFCGFSIAHLFITKLSTACDSYYCVNNPSVYRIIRVFNTQCLCNWMISVIALEVLENEFLVAGW